MNKKLLNKIESIIILSHFLIYFNFCAKIKSPILYFLLRNCYSYGFIMSDKIERYNFHITIYYIL